jgi:hypothetical protein
MSGKGKRESGQILYLNVSKCTVQRCLGNGLDTGFWGEAYFAAIRRFDDRATHGKLLLGLGKNWQELSAIDP